MKATFNNRPFNATGNISFAGASIKFEPYPTGQLITLNSAQDISFTLTQEAKFEFGMGSQKPIDKTLGTSQGEGSFTLLETDLTKLRIASTLAGNDINNTIIGMEGNIIIVGKPTNVLGTIGSPKSCILKYVTLTNDGWDGALQDTLKKQISFIFADCTFIYL